MFGNKSGMAMMIESMLPDEMKDAISKLPEIGQQFQAKLLEIESRFTRIENMLLQIDGKLDSIGHTIDPNKVEEIPATLQAMLTLPEPTGIVRSL